ncbi:MAG: sigma-54 dependent transcriptional regulator [bacterium]
MATALIVDDDALARESLAEWVEAQGFRTCAAEDLASGREIIRNERIDVALLDLDLPSGSGLELLPDLEQQRAVDVVFITGFSSVDSAVEAFRGGAVDYLTKPLDLKRLRSILERARRTAVLSAEIGSLRHELRELGRFGKLIGTSAPMQHVYDLIERVAPTDATVLVTGETGTGKELVAQTIHALSRRAHAPFVPINCGALAPTLIESELFGHERGSFTGAERTHKGVFERAHGGTLFLDEVAEMPLELQVRLLRVLEAGAVRRVGGDGETVVDLRVVAATNVDPRKAVAQGKLREDLLYRLLIFPIELPPLRQRTGDVALLAQFFVDALDAKCGTRKRLAAGACDRLEAYGWPGNVRQLKHVMERAHILARDEIGVACIQLDDGGPARGEASVVEVGASIAEVERRLILATLEHTGGDKKHAATLLGISLKTLYNRLATYSRG